MKTQCIGTPISWLELERYVLGESLSAKDVGTHLAECRACEQVKCAIEADERSMPALVIPSPSRPPRTWWRWAAALVPIALLVVVWRAQQPETRGNSGVKGDALSLTLVRERSGRLLKPTHHAPGDRFKALVSCAPGLRLVDLVVRQDGALNLPIPTSVVDCGNAIPLPGAFTLEGGVAEVCVQLVSEKDQGEALLRDDAVCRVVAPERSPRR